MNLKMSLIMGAVDKITAPIKKVTSSTQRMTESMKATKAELDKIGAQQKDIAHFKSLKRRIAEIKPELKQQQAEVDRLAAAYNSAEKPTAKMKQQLGQARLKLLNLNGELKDQRTKLKTVVVSLNEAGIKTNRLAETTRRLDQQSQKYTETLDKTKHKLKTLSDQEERLSKAQAKRAKSMQLASNTAIAGASMTYASQQTRAAIANPVNIAGDFEAQMSKVRAISKATDQEMARLSGQGRALGAETVFSATQVAEAQNFLAVAGFNTNKILAATPYTLKLAQAGNVDLGRAADIASDALTGLGMEAHEMQRMADVLAYTTTTANTNVEMLGESLKTSAGVAGAYGGTIEQVSAMLGIMANSGIKGAQAGTALSSMYSRLSAPPTEGKRALEDLGVEVFDLEGKLRAMPDILQDIAAATEGMSDTDTAPLFKAIFGAEAGIMAGSKALMQAANKNQLLDYVKQLEGAQGTADRIAGQMTDNLQGTQKAWDSALESLKISAGTALIPTIRELTTWITDLTRRFDAFAQENPGVVKWLGIIAIAFAAITGVIGPLMMAISGLVGAYGLMSYALTFASVATAKFNIITALGSGVMKGFAAAQWLVNAAFAANPIGLVIAGVAALVALAAYLVDDWGAVGDWFVGLWDKVIEIVGAVGDAIKSALSWFSDDEDKTVNVTEKRQQIAQRTPQQPEKLQQATESVQQVPGVSADEQQITRRVESLPGVAGENQQITRKVDQVPGVTDDSQRISRKVESVPGVSADEQQITRRVESLPGVTGENQQITRKVDQVPGVTDDSQRISRKVESVPGVLSEQQLVNRTVENLPRIEGDIQQIKRVTNDLPELPEQLQQVDRKVNNVASLPLKAAAVTTALTTALPLAADVQPKEVVQPQVQVVPAQPLTPNQSKSVTIEGDKYEINFSVAPGMDERELMAMFRSEIEMHDERKQRKLRGALND